MPTPLIVAVPIHSYFCQISITLSSAHWATSSTRPLLPCLDGYTVCRHILISSSPLFFRYSILLQCPLIGGMRPSCPLLKHGFTRRHLIECRPGNLDPPLVQRSLKGLNQSPLKIRGQEVGSDSFPPPAKVQKRGRKRKGRKFCVKRRRTGAEKAKRQAKRRDSLEHSRAWRLLVFSLFFFVLFLSILSLP